MTLLCLYPGIATTTTAEFKAVVLGDDAFPGLRVAPDTAGLDVGPEQALTLDNGVKIRTLTAVASGLAENTEVVVSAFEGATEIQTARARTLPSALGAAGSELHVFLASCYCRLNPASGKAGDLFKDLFRAYGTPHLKIWCGDQVYLDSPATHFMTHWNLSNEELADSHFTHYMRTWSADQLGVALARGANAFAPDDHEFWNNSPYPNATVPGLYNAPRRKKWLEIARELIGAFQPVGTRSIDVPPLSILVLDTRSNRTPTGPRKDFMKPGDMQRLRDWVAGLANKGPGFLVMGQPLLHHASAKWFLPQVVEDYSLADYSQYVELLQILERAPRDIAILTGDVHFSRAARLLMGNGRTIHEIINSPLALVVGLGRATPSDAKGLAKVAGAPLITAGTVSTDPGFRSNEDSAVALSIRQDGLKVHVNVDLWSVNDSPGAAGPKIPSYQFTLM